MTSYFDIYLNQLFTTLGQLTAILVSSTVFVPVYTYYSRRLILDEHKTRFRNELRELVAEHNTKTKFQQSKEE